MLRPLRVTCEIIAGVTGTLVVLLLFLLWRWIADPTGSAQMTPYLEAAIEDLMPGTHVTVGNSVLTWNRAEPSIDLRSENIRIKDSEEKALAEIPSLNLTLSVPGLLLGQFWPKYLSVASPKLRLDRQSDGSFTFGRLENEAQANGTVNNEDLRTTLGRLATALSKAQFTNRLQIRQGLIDVRDAASSTRWSIRAENLELSRRGNMLDGAAKIELVKGENHSSGDVHYSFDSMKGVHTLETIFSDITPAFFAPEKATSLDAETLEALNLPLSGKVLVTFDTSFRLEKCVSTIHGGSGSILFPPLWPEPQKIKTIDTEFSFSRTQKKLEIGSLAVDFFGPTLALSAQFVPEKEAQDFWENSLFAVKLSAARVPMQALQGLWPPRLLPAVRKWMTENLSKGVFGQAEAEIKGSLDVQAAVPVTVREATGKITATDATIRYFHTMPPVENVSAVADFNSTRLTAKINGGNIGFIKILPLTLTIDGFEGRNETIHIPLHLKSDLSSFLDLINNAPLGYAKEAGISPNEVSGNLDTEIRFDFPLLKDLKAEQLRVTAKGTLTEGASKTLLNYAPVTKANLDLFLDATNLTLRGPALIGGAPALIEWKRTLAGETLGLLSTASVTASLTARDWDDLGITIFDGSEGAMTLSVERTENRHSPPLIKGTLDMSAAAVRIPTLSLKKPAKVTAIASFTGAQAVDGAFVFSQIEAHGPGLDIRGSGRTSKKGDGVATLDFDKFKIGHNDTSLRYQKLEGTSGGTVVEATGESLDISGLKPARSGATTAGNPEDFRLDVNKLITSGNGFIAKARGYARRDAQGWNEIHFRGLADGSHLLSIELTKDQASDEDQKHFSLTCDDFGEALKGLGMTDTVSGGAVEIEGNSDPGDKRAIVGVANIGAFNIRGLPLLAVLMNAASPFGFAGLFSDSMDFDRVHGGFRWKGDSLTFNGLHAAGAAIGINIGGNLNLATGAVDVKGTMVPFSVLNGVIGSIPIIGTLITGGKGQGFFAVTYAIHGQVGDPQINVDPASLLTPGILRNFFFGSELDEGVSPALAPVSSP